MNTKMDASSLWSSQLITGVRYDSHLQGLKTLKQKSPNWTLAMQKRMYEAAWLVFHFLCVHCLLEFFIVSMQRLPERSPKSQPLIWTT